MSPEHPPAIAHLVVSYLETWRRVSYLRGRELREATTRLIRLAAEVDARAPGLDWGSVWKEGASRNTTPSEWPDEANEVIAWLGSLDPATVPPFFVSVGWPVPEPVEFFARLRREVARGPGGPHAERLAGDLVRVMTAATAAIASSKRPTPAQLIHGTGPRELPHQAREWDPETARRLEWLATVSLPADPFRLDGRRMVSDPAAFIERLRLDAAAGPDGPRARSGALQEDLEMLERALSAIADAGESSTNVDTGRLLTMVNTGEVCAIAHGEEVTA